MDANDEIKWKWLEEETSDEDEVQNKVYSDVEPNVSVDHVRQGDCESDSKIYYDDQRSLGKEINSSFGHKVRFQFLLSNSSDDDVPLDVGKTTVLEQSPIIKFEYRDSLNASITPLGI